MKSEFVDEKEEVTSKDDAIYEIMLNLRTNKGLDLIRFKEKFSIDLYQDKKDKIDKFIEKKWLILDFDKQKLTPTYDGMMVLDQIILYLI